VTGVSIGAITTAAIAGAKNKDIVASLKRLWDAITLKPIPFWPATWQSTLSLWGNPAFWTPRSDYLNFPQWTSYCDVTPMHATLETVCDFDQLNNPGFVRLSVTATDVQSGGQVTFSNLDKPLPAGRKNAPVQRTRLTPDHFLASGSLPPGFPMTIIDNNAYWDGGLFDNTPIQALLDLLSEDEIENLPIFVVDLFPTKAPLPTNLGEVQQRMINISYENRFWAQDNGTIGDCVEFAHMLEALARDLPAESPVRTQAPFQRLQRLRALKNIRVIGAPASQPTGFMDFSAAGVSNLYGAGYGAVH
jgi:NTE family protein